jgi:threonine dehydrogenase-like Zn-dependent dehydrogenase
MGRDVDGGFADLVAVDEQQLHPLPAALDHPEAVLLQVLGTCVHGQDSVEVFPGQSAVVIGLGVTGLLHVQLLRARGLDRILGVTRSEWKRAVAERVGASFVAGPEEARDALRDLTGGRGADLVVESVGTTSTLAQAIELAAPGGTLLMFGTIVETAGTLPFYDLYFKELVLRGTRAARPRDYARAIELAGSGQVALRPLLSRSYPLEEAPAALGDASGQGPLKITLEISHG